MRPEIWERAKSIFEQAMAIAPDGRAQFLDEVCSGDNTVRREVEELLASLDNSVDFLERPALHEVAREIVGELGKLVTGQKLLHYEIIKPIGEGGMGEIYLAYDTKLSRRVAIKLLPRSTRSSEEANQRLLREARAAAKLDHPNICTIHEIAESEGRSFIVMQFIEGETLAKKIKEGALKLSDNVGLATQIAEALAQAHANNIIHRDIKPANIVITEKGLAIVLDFGLAKFIDQENLVGAEAVTAHLFSTAGAIMGTVPYMSPEQVKGEQLDLRTDIFSFGSMFYEMLCATQPFHRNSNAETISAILSYEPSTFHLPNELARVLQKCLAKNKDLRYRDAAELVLDLKGLPAIPGDKDARLMAQNRNSLRSEHPATRLAAQASPTITFSVTNYKWKAVAALLVLIFGGLAVGSYFLSKTSPQNQPTGAPKIDSLAVLPFENEDKDTEYLSDGITESLINSLSNLPNLRVISRTTVFGFKGKNESTEEIGRDLKVRAVLTGKFSQSADLVTIQAELVDLTTNSQLWGERFSVKTADLLQVQDQLAKQIADTLQLKLDSRQRAQIAKHYTDNPDAYREYLKGRYYTLQYTAEGHAKALEHLNKAIETDPTYALAYAGLADAYTTASDALLSPRDALAKAKAAAQKALDLDNSLAEAWAAHGHARLHEWDKGAIDDLNRSIELAPNTLTNQLWLGEYYLIWDVERSVKVLERAAELDPLSPLPPSFISFAYYMLRQPARSIEYGKKAMVTDPGFYGEHAYLARFYSFGGDYRSAMDELDKIPPEAADVFTISTRGSVFAREGERADAENAIAELQRRSEKQYVSPIEIAFVYNVLGDRDKTFLYLEKAFDDRSENLSFIRNLPDYDRIRDDPRYSDLMHRMGF